jgi:hypothetical protein
MNAGVVVEGPDDAAVYPILIRRIDPSFERVYPRECTGRQKLKNKFLYFLEEFAGNPAALDIRKVLVIRDSDCNDPERIEQDLQTIFANSNLRLAFSVSFHATKCELETWLLADEDAINTVSARRGSKGRIRRVEIDLENFREPKELYRRTLSQAGLQDTGAVMKQIAQEVRLEVVAARCPRFGEFVQKVTDP